jgi:hypothetical protein
MPIDCGSAGVITLRGLMKSPLHNVNRPNSRPDKAATSLSGPSFVPDGSSSTRSGWHTLGQAVGRADQGEIVGKGTGGSGILTAPQFFTGIKPFANHEATGGAELVPHLIHNRSGARSDVLALDLNGDGRMDIITSTRSGTYIFWGSPAD